MTYRPNTSSGCQTSFTLQLKILGKQLQAEVRFSDNRRSLINRLCKLHSIPKEYTGVMFEKITESLNAMMRSETIAQSLIEKILSFLHKGPVEEEEGEGEFGEGVWARDRDREREREREKIREDIRKREKEQLEFTPTVKRFFEQTNSECKERRVREQDILRDSLAINRQSQRIPSTAAATFKKPLQSSLNSSAQKQSATRRNNYYKNSTNSNKKVLFEPPAYQPKTTSSLRNTNTIQSRSSRTARFMPHRSRPEPSSTLKLFSRQAEQITRPAAIRESFSSELKRNDFSTRKSIQHISALPSSCLNSRRMSTSSANILRRYKYLGDSEYAQSYYV